jgi:hypothetical protein
MMKKSTQEGQNSAVNKTSVESTAQDDLQEVKRHKRHIYNNASHAAKKSTKPFPTSIAVEMPPKAVLTRNFFAPLRPADMDTETTEGETTLLGQKAPRKPSRPPPIMMTSTTNPFDSNDHIKGKHKFQKTRNGTRIITKDRADYSVMIF